MIRAAVTLATVLLLSRVAMAQEGPVAPPAAFPAKPQPPKYNPNDPKSIIDFIIKESNSLRNERDLLALRNRQNELERLLAGLPAGVPELQEAIKRAAEEVEISRQGVYVLTTAMEVLMQNVRDNPHDAYNATYMRDKLYGEIEPLFFYDPDAASSKLAAARAVATKAMQVSRNEKAKAALTAMLEDAVQYERNIDASKDALDKQRALIGQEALPLVVETWFNGKPLGADEIKGKVVLLGFFSADSWRVGGVEEDFGEDWPAYVKQLAEWQNKYAERGLIVISATGYGNVRWDEAQQAPMRILRNMGVVPPEEERAMLTKLIRSQGWTQRVAILSSEEHLKRIRHYPAISEPTIVIDRQGRIRLVRTGVYEQFTRDIGKELESLLGSADHR